MAVSSPAAWDRFNRLSIIPETLSGEYGPAGPRELFARRSSYISRLSADTDVGALLMRGRARGSGASAVRARRLVADLGMSSPDATEQNALRVVSSQSSRAGRTVVLQQQVRGHDVVGASVKVHFSRTGDFVVSGRAMVGLRARTPRTEVRTTPKLAASQAARSFEVEASTIRETELQSFPMPDGETRWVWRVSLVSEDPVADVRIYLDAESLEVLLSFNIASALSGWVRVYPQNPLRTPRLEDVRLRDLGPIPDDRLAGRRLVVIPGTPPPLTSPGRDFRRDENAVGFDEGNAYYHLRNALRWFTALKGRRPFASPPFRPVRALIRDRSSRKNAYYLPSDGKLRFGDFDAGPSARSADVIYHELGHAVSDNASKLGRGLPDSESRGLSEGYSDYFSNSALDNPWMCEWVEPSKARNSADPTLRFPADFGGLEHDTGAVWAAVLWGIRSQIPQRDADRIAYESLYHLGPSSTFSEAKAALRTASEELSEIGKIDRDYAADIEQQWMRRL